MNHTDHAGEQRFELTTFLHGRSRAWGVFEDRFGRVQRRLAVEMTGRWEGGNFLLDEVFRYDTGEVETRTWLVVPGKDGSFTASCPDCVGQAAGVCDKDSVRMRYRFRLKMERRTIDVDFDDRIYRVEDAIAVNRARMSKWGFRLGELSLFFVRDGAGA